MVSTDEKVALTSSEGCFICGSSVFEQLTEPYLRCINCGHEILDDDPTQSFIINEPLEEKITKKTTSLDRFKNRTTEHFGLSDSKMLLLDIGSASGRFLFFQSENYERVAGIEVTNECLNFSRSVFGLNIYEKIDAVPEGINMATAWHSLEHIPILALLDILAQLSMKLTAGGRFIISVPNGNSRQRRWFRERYAYFDVPNHIHQFTSASLDHLLSNFGFRQVGQVTSWPYNTFGYTQGILNTLTHSHNYLYYRLKRRSQKKNFRADLANFMLLPFILPVCGLLSILDAFEKTKSSVITVCYEIKKP